MLFERFEPELANEDARGRPERDLSCFFRVIGAIAVPIGRPR